MQRQELRDLGRLWDMINAGRQMSEFVQGRTFMDFFADIKLRYAIERMLEIFGEAARHTSEDRRGQLTEINWRLIVAQRNVIAHEYGDIDYAQIWRFVTEEVPRVIAILNDHLRQFPPPPARS